MKHRYAILGLSLSLSVGAWAQELPIRVQAECENQGFSTFKYSFDLHYSAESLPEDAQVKAIVGYSGRGSVSSIPERESFDWDLEREIVLSRQEAGIWQSAFRLYYMQTGGYYSDLDLKFQIRLPDGTTYWDHGGSDPSFYRAHFFDEHFDCGQLVRPRELKVSIRRETPSSVPKSLQTE